MRNLKMMIKLNQKKLVSDEVFLCEKIIGGIEHVHSMLEIIPIIKPMKEILRSSPKIKVNNLASNVGTSREGEKIYVVCSASKQIMGYTLAEPSSPINVLRYQGINAAFVVLTPSS